VTGYLSEKERKKDSVVELNVMIIRSD